MSLTPLSPYPLFSFTYLLPKPQALCRLANEWQNMIMMPDGIALRDVEDDCAALYHALVDVAPIVVLTWPQVRQPSLATEGGQPLATEVLYLNHMGETERKWYLKQHEFTTSLQRYVCVTHLFIWLCY
jgi:hypothetical protein